MRGSVRFDTGPLGRGPDGCGTLFADPVAVIRADTPDQVSDAFAAIEAARRDGLWLAGCFSYELGYALTPKLAPLMPARRDMPLILMGIYDAPRPAPPLPAPGRARIGTPDPLWDRATYDAAIARVHAYIEAGDCYQINLTFPMEATCDGTPEQIYAALAARQPVGEGALVMLGDTPILSRSPELFFTVDADRMIATRPMKGTRARHVASLEDEAAVEALKTSEKDLAENLMIVDLLRNDISRVCRAGSVHVPQLFAVETYTTVHQMVSTVRGELAEDAGLTEIVRALFPCGSITGAPKVRAMEIISELESGPRDIYCGAIGWADPDGPMRFNVAIRSPVMTAPGRLRLNVGGGIVNDSRAEGEWDEALWKARFANLSPTG
ncbi:aminodeoxychorismate synthase component I [Paracoccus sp. TK19116]|uniref:Aminodeoxychorismate synthase component I n=1 Tax=Paracoccus albicereus TaxID=2922394 RepID=A0ABT1MTV0_9RHOB|nr:aminodeoxychorismate synthase component I [Paracoccus albicereus]MCQ0971758.1 aminodeoxychorismate synthase component I [Paracoccus albicereus]